MANKDLVVSWESDEGDTVHVRYAVDGEMLESGGYLTAADIVVICDDSYGQVTLSAEECVENFTGDDAVQLKQALNELR